MNIIPLRVKKNNRRLTIRRPWISKGILKSIHTKNALFKQYIRKPGTISFHEKFKRYRNKLNAIIRLARKEYYKKKIQSASGQSSTTWKVLNEILGKSIGKDFPTELHVNGGITSDPKEMVNILNSYFVNIGINLSNSSSSGRTSFVDTLLGRCNKSMFFKPATANEVLSIVKNLKKIVEHVVTMV